MIDDRRRTAAHVRAGPVRERVLAGIQDEIRASSLAPGDGVPSERELALRFGVSRSTIRGAIRDLVDAGVLEVRPGSGTYVADTPPGVAAGRGGVPLGEDPNVLMSFTELAASRGLTPTSDVLNVGVRSASIDEADKLGTAPGASLLEIERVRRMDGVAVAVDRTRVPVAVAGTLEGLDWSRESVYAVLERAGSRPVRAEYEVQAVPADERTAALLDVEPGYPLLHARTIVSRADGRLVELGDTLYRGDRYRYRATLQRGDR